MRLERRFAWRLIVAAWYGTAAVQSGAATLQATAPGVVIVSVDALRADRMSCYGYPRATSPAADELAASGARFAAARTVEPLTGPAMVSAFTGVPPHRHGASRNGLNMRPDLPSLAKQLRHHGWYAAAVISNWTLRGHITLLDEHFDDYLEVLTRKRWFGLVNSEAVASDVTDAAIAWLDRYDPRAAATRPFLLWVHYVEPHAPYRFHPRAADRLGIPRRNPSRQDRYDTEVATADSEIGRLLSAVHDRLGDRQPIVVLLADHGESLGEHGYWGHGRDLYEPSLRIPLMIAWPGHIVPTTITAPASILDLAPTVLGLLGLTPDFEVTGHDWTPQLLGREPAPDRTMCLEAHKGAVQVKHASERARSRGLLEVAVVRGHAKEIFDVRASTIEAFDLAADPLELQPRKPGTSAPSEALMRCVGEVTAGLGALDRLAANRLDDDSIAQLRALGYLE